MEYQNMRKYSHDEFINIISNMNENELTEFSQNYGGYPVFFRMALDTKVKHIPFIQTGSAIIIRNEKKEILLQERTDRNKWGLPGGCQELGEKLEQTAIREVFEETGIKLDINNLIFIDILSGNTRKNNYPNGDIVYNNTVLYLIDVSEKEILEMRGNSETKRLKFFNINELPNNLNDEDLIEAYYKYMNIM